MTHMTHKKNKYIHHVNKTSYMQAAACYISKKREVAPTKNRFAVLQQKEEVLMQKMLLIWLEKLHHLRNILQKKQQIPMPIAAPTPVKPQKPMEPVTPIKQGALMPVIVVVPNKVNLKEVTVIE